MATLQDYKMVTEDGDWINLGRFNNSLKELLVRYPDECPNHVIAGALMIDESDVEVLYAQIVVKLRSLMGVEAL
jgi:hypothetical protein